MNPSGSCRIILLYIVRFALLKFGAGSFIARVHELKVRRNVKDEERDVRWERKALR